MNEFFGGFTGIVLFVFAIIMGIVWIVLPVAVLGIRNRLDRMLLTMDKIQKSLEAFDKSEAISGTVNAPAKDETSQTQVIEKSR